MREFDAAVRRRRDKRSVGSFTAVTAVIGRETDLTTLLPERIRAAGAAGLEPFVLVGLHCCGALGTATLELFARTEAARALAMVSCCYNKLELIDRRAGALVEPKRRRTGETVDERKGLRTRAVALA